MEMSLMHAGLAGGAALAALPVILHLFMKQTPKHVVFPALRLIRERQKRSKKRLRVKNWLLLLARMAVLALMALALARPRVYSEAPLGDQSVPTALALVFDTSLSMNYKDKDKTRLDDAKDKAREIINKLPGSSQVFVVDSSAPGVTPLAPNVALKRVDELTTHAAGRPLNVAVGEAYQALLGAEKPVRLAYVLTDLARTAWDPDQPVEGLDEIAKLKAGKKAQVATFVLRLAPEELSNAAVDVAEAPRSVMTAGEPFDVRAVVRSQGPASRRMVEFYLDGLKRGEKPVELLAGAGEAEVRFAAPAQLEAGVLHRGRIVLSGAPDPFADDDQRFFTFKVRPALKVLIVYDRLVDAEFVGAAIDPDVSEGQPRTSAVTLVHSSKFAARDKDALETAACVFVLNVARLSEEDWGALNQYVHQGGGLVVGLGNNCDPENYNGAIAAQLLPGRLGEKHAPASATSFGTITDVNSALFGGHGKEIDGELGRLPVYRYWALQPQKDDQPIDGARVLMTFADGAPALLERAFKGQRPGRALLWTTPLSRRAFRADPDAWNEFPNTEASWAFPVLMDLTVPYMAGTAAEQLNFEAGENVFLKLDSKARPSRFTITGPDKKTSEAPAPSGGDVLEVPAPQLPGQWTVNGAASGGRRAVVLGFSLNPPRGESRFAPLAKPELDTLFGKDGCHLAENAQAFQDKDKLVRYGHEIFPWLMFLVLVVVTLENFLANTFYKETPRPDAAARGAA